MSEQTNLNLTRREIVRNLGISLGKTNYLIKAFPVKGLLIINNFKRSDNNLSYLYALTPEGVEVKK